MSGGLASPSPACSPPHTSTEEPLSTPANGPPAAKLRMTVTSGFYVRSLCHDLGAAVGSAALMAELERTRQGDFEVGKNVLEYTDLKKGEKVWGPQVEAMLDEWYKKEKQPSQNEGKSSSQNEGKAPQSEEMPDQEEPAAKTPAVGGFEDAAAPAGKTLSS
jgi:tRNA U55 pseudouridine synthase TruB